MCVHNSYGEHTEPIHMQPAKVTCNPSIHSDEICILGMPQDINLKNTYNFGVMRSMLTMKKMSPTVTHGGPVGTHARWTA